MSTINTILFIELLGGIGDLVIALPAIRALARSHPSANLSVLTFAPGGELLESDPLIHRVIYAKAGEARRSVEALLANEHFDLIVSDTTYEGIADLIADSSAIQTVTNLWRSPPPDQLVSDRFLHLLLNDGLIRSDAILPNEAQIHLTTTERTIAHAAFGATYRPVVVLCPDAGMPIKRWSIDRFTELGQSLQHQHDATLIIPSGTNPTQAEQLATAIGGTARVWQRGSLRQFTAMLAEADLVIAADTAPAHMAAALTIPTITLFGPSWSDRYGHAAPHINLQGFPQCPERKIHNFTEQSCWYSGDCPFEWNTCLDDITPEQVLNAATQLLQQRREKENELTQYHTLTIQSASTDRSPNWHSLQNILVLRLDNIGDVIMTSPTLRTIKENLPHAKLTLMASPAGALTAPLLPWVDEVLPYRSLWQDLGKLPFDPQREWKLIDTLKSHQFDAAIILTSFSQSPHPPALLCALADIPLRLGESKETDIGTLTHAVAPAPDDIHQVDRNLRLIEAIGFKVRDRRLTLHPPNPHPPSPNPHPPSPNPHPPSPNPYLILNPWTSCQSRNYAPDRFAIAARQIKEITGYAIVVTGVEKDREQSHHLFELLGEGAIDLIGKTSLPDLVTWVAHAKLVLTNNTSTMHIADATQTPNIILFAGTELERQWRPRYSPSRLLRRPTVCNPCYAFQCPYQLECLDISPEDVVNASLEVLQLQAVIRDRQPSRV